MLKKGPKKARRVPVARITRVYIQEFKKKSKEKGGNASCPHGVRFGESDVGSEIGEIDQSGCLSRMGWWDRGMREGGSPKS